MNNIPQLDALLTSIETLLRNLGLVIAVICIIVAGLMRIISFGNERRIMISNMAFAAALVGLAIVLLATGLAAFIQNNIH